MSAPARMDSGSEGEEEVESPDQELAHLKSKLRKRQKTRKDYMDEKRIKLERQQYVIRQLEKEALEMETDLALAGSRKVVSRDDAAIQKMVRLQHKEGKMQRLVADEEEAGKTLEAQVKEMRSMVQRQQKAIGGVHGQQQKHLAIKKHVRVMENRLNTLTKEFNSMLVKNRVLRQTIDHFGTERKTFEKVRRELDEKLTTAKLLLQKVVDDSVRAHEGREDLAQKTKVAREKADKEFAQFNQELKELVRGIDHSRMLQEFMATKVKERVSPEEIQVRQIAVQVKKPAPDKANSKKFEKMLQDLMKVSGIEDMKQIVARFLEVEEDNFALFNYINEQENTMDDLRSEVARVTGSINHMHEEGVKLDAQREQLMKRMETQLNGSTRRHNNLLKRFQEERLAVDQLKTGIGSLFNRMDCDPTPINDLLGGQTGITDASVIQYLAIVEQRCTELLQLQTFLLDKSATALLKATRESALVAGEDAEHAVEKARATLPVTMLLGTVPEPPARLEHAVDAPNVFGETDGQSGESSDEGEVVMDLAKLRERALSDVRKKDELKLRTLSPPGLDADAGLSASPSGVSRTTSRTTPLSRK